MQLASIIKGWATTKMIQTADSSWDANSPATQQVIENAASDVQGIVDDGRRRMTLGLVCWIAAFGIPRFAELNLQSRIDGYSMLFRLAPYHCCLVLYGPLIDRCMDLAQIFNPLESNSPEARRLLVKLVESR